MTWEEAKVHFEAHGMKVGDNFTEGERRWLTRVAEAHRRFPVLTLVEHLSDPLMAIEGGVV